MDTSQMAKYVRAISPAAIIDNASASATAIDCLGYSSCEIIVQLGAMDIAMTVLKVQHSDDNSSYSDITGATFDGGTSADGTTLALPSATDDDQPHVFQINCVGRKRYMKVVATCGDGAAGTYIAASARLSRGAFLSDTDTNLAAGGICRV